MNIRRRIRFTALLSLATAMLVLPSSRAAITILRPFTGGTTGGEPLGSLTLSGTKLYGLASTGGSSPGFAGSGTAFSINTDGTGYTRLHLFAGGPGDGREPHGALTLSGSTLYGMTALGGSGNQGTIFSMNTDGTGYSVLRNFTSSGGGYSPYGSLALSGSKLYGMTQYSGTLFSMNTDGTGFGVLHTFLGNDGGIPLGSLTLSGSTLYGMTSNGGTGVSTGTIFSVNTDGTGFATLHGFATHEFGEAGPSGSLTLSGSKLYGMTPQNGASGRGTAFSMNTDGTGYTLLHTFTGGTSDGQNPRGSLTLSGSKLYGMTNGGGTANYGTIFSMNTDGTGYALLESFGGAPDGAYPRETDLTLSGNGSLLYGMTQQGGIGNAGVIFSKSIVPEPSALLLLAAGAGLLLRRRRG